ncbi:MAG: nuclear transport factor 2 family protein [Deltaproteobacteria bacterium]|nr:nuclear transport factor 2 family protein [Myxococcales bacterium]MDP3220609.1 nuclear transport factor 2 family protein [Deltaproteobacteria bacterium]
MSDEAAALLRVLVEGDTSAVAEALHADVVFVQGDGTEHRGAEAVVAMFTRADGSVRYAVVAVEAAAVRVELTVPGMPGAVRFTLCGMSEAGRLVRVRVEA